MKFKLFIVCFVSCYTCLSQDVLIFSDARSVSLGGIYSLTTGWWSCISNPAGMAEENSAGFGLNYGNYYGIPETATGAFTLNVSAKPGILGIGFVSSGFSSINESRVALAYARTIGKTLRAGIGINWLHFTQPGDYRDLYSWVPSIGLQWLPHEKWTAAINFINPAMQEYIPKGYRQITSLIAAGTEFRPSDELFLMFELQKPNQEPLKYLLGIEASLVPSFAMRIGLIRHYCFMYSAGIGYSKGKIVADAAVSHHPVLGFSPSLSVNFNF